MDKSNNYFPKDAREKVMIYQLLSELETFTENAQSRRILGIFPVSSESLKFDIRRWVNEQHKLLRDDD